MAACLSLCGENPGKYKCSLWRRDMKLISFTGDRSGDTGCWYMMTHPVMDHTPNSDQPSPLPGRLIRLAQHTHTVTLVKCINFQSLQNLWLLACRSTWTTPTHITRHLRIHNLYMPNTVHHFLVPSNLTCSRTFFHHTHPTTTQRELNEVHASRLVQTCGPTGSLITSKFKCQARV